MHWTEKLGHNPKKSWRLFFIGLFFFWVFAILLWFSVAWPIFVFYLLVVALIASFGLAIWGYVGIFANRFYHLRQRQAEYKRVFSTKD